MSEPQGRRRRLLQVGSAAVFLAFAAVLVLIVISANDTSGGDTKLEDVALVNRDLKGIPQRGTVLGDPQAKVTLFEFGDLQCPVCKGFSEEIVPEVIDSKVRSGKAKIEFRNYTIISQESIPAGAAAIAAGRQGRGWNYIELFYRNQGQEASGYVTDEFLTAIARGAGVRDIAGWNEDRKSAKAIAQVEATTAEAQRLGFTGTPSFAVAGPGTKGMETLGTPGSAGQIEEAIEAAG
ncbi:MAG TPA: thioredoxin domain-containing protein [Solirubrobacterales bacterium]|nr:thioredoxin domain-containing protein [Solirubrobacterales bacterium]